MTRLFKAAAALVCLAGSVAFGSTSSMTATVTDTDGTAWSNATYTAVLQLQGQPGAVPTISGTPVSPLTVSGTASASGVIAGTFTDTSSLDQKNGQWVFTIRPNASGASVSLSVAIIGATPNLTNNFSSLKAPRFPAGPYAYGYADGEVTNVALGGSYFNVVTPCPKTFTQAGWQCGGGGGGGGGASFTPTGIQFATSTTAATVATGAQIAAAIGATAVTNATNAVNATSATNAVAANAVGVVPFEGTVVPVFKTLNGFDNLGNALGNAFALGSGGSGVVAAVQGTLSSGYRRINRDCDTSRVCRIDFLVNWDPTDTTGSIQVGLGPSTNRYQVVLNNTASGTLQATFFNVGGTTTAVSGAVGSSVIQLSVGVTVGNGGVTTYVCPTGAQHGFTAPNNWLSCQYFYQHINSSRLNNIYFGSSSATSTIVGFMANTNGLDGDPSGRILTRAVAQNIGGTPNCVGSCTTAIFMDHENVMYLAERSNPAVPVKTVYFFHGRTSNGGPDNCGGPNQSAVPTNTYSVCYALLAAGYNVLSDQGGNGFTNSYSDYWGAPHGEEYAKQTYDTYVKNTYNPGKVYVIGQSMGGVGSLNFMRTYPNIVSAAYEATPAIDLNETGCPLGIACSGSTLKATMDTAYKLLYVSVTPTLSLTLSAAATASGGSTVYTGTITGGGSNAFAGIKFVIAGFTTGANNGTFVATASTTTTLTLSNAAGVAETHAGTATSTNTGNDPAVDSGVNWIPFAEAGANPNIGGRSWNFVNTTAASTNSHIVTIGATANCQPGDYLFFTGANQVRRIEGRVGPSNAGVLLDSAITVVSGELVRIIHALPNGKPDPTSFDYTWLNTITGGVGSWASGSAYSFSNLVYWNSSTPDLDESAWNPTRIPEAYGNAAIQVAMGGDGTCTSNDGILNNQQMCDFVNAVNAVYPGTASTIATPGGHVTPAMQPSIILPFFAAH